MKKLSVEFWGIVILLLAGLAACIISGSVAGAIACALLGAAGFISYMRINSKKQ